MKQDVLDKGCSDLRIVLEEGLIQDAMEKNYWEEFKEFGIVEGFECMVDEVNRIYRLINFHDELTGIRSDKELLEEFILYLSNKESENEKRYKLTKDEERIIKEFLIDLYGDKCDV